MIRIVGGRNIGKTTALIRQAVEKSYDIVAPTSAIATCIADTARWMGFPVRMDSKTNRFMIGEIYILIARDLLIIDGVRRKRDVVIDELELAMRSFLPGITVAGYTISADDELQGSEDPGKPPVWKNGESVIHVSRADGTGGFEKNKWADWTCPACGWFVGEQYIPRHHNQRKSNFCSHCGQKIDWANAKSPVDGG